MTDHCTPKAQPQAHFASFQTWLTQGLYCPALHCEPAVTSGSKASCSWPRPPPPLQADPQVMSNVLELIQQTHSLRYFQFNLNQVPSFSQQNDADAFQKTSVQNKCHCWLFLVIFIICNSLTCIHKAVVYVHYYASNMQILCALCINMYKTCKKNPKIWTVHAKYAGT